MGIVILIVLAILESGGFIAAMYLSLAKRKHDAQRGIDSLKEQLDEKKGLLEKVKGLFDQLCSMDEIKQRVREIRALQESLKTERGRITITQAELETVEGRLRELEEIDRELEASNLETKEEVNILKKKEKDLTNKNDTLKAQLKGVMQQVDGLLGEITENAELEAKVQAMRSDLVQTEERIDSLLLGIEQGNEQYFVLKRRYDALDIEYAQLYEKFSEAEPVAKPPPTSL